jgi:hypothetical protein
VFVRLIETFGRFDFHAIGMIAVEVEDFGFAVVDPDDGVAGLHLGGSLAFALAHDAINGGRPC